MLQVSVSYSKNRTQPGDTVDVKVSAVTGSMVGLLAVDQSVLLLAGGNDITQADASIPRVYLRIYKLALNDKLMS